ncbi:MAG: acyl-CoA dehydrogenase family protein [Acidimicrobiales bacterium]
MTVSINESDEQEELRRTLRRFLASTSNEGEVRRLMEDDLGFSPTVWQQMADQLGLQGLMIPEVFGGSGYGLEEMCVVFEEMGRSLLPAPFFSTVALASFALLTSGDEDAMRRYLPGIASGETIATVAISESEGGWDSDAITMPAVRSGEEWTISGTKRYVVDGHASSLILVPARAAEGITLFAVDARAPGIEATSRLTLDMTRKLSEISFHGTPAALIGAAGDAWPTLERALLMASVALAAEQVGGSQRVLEMTVEYAKSRYQFGRAIGSFQAVKHKCANMFVETELASFALRAARRAFVEGADDFAILAHSAKSLCAETFSKVSAENIQVHGGMGFTWDHPAHLYLKRAKSGEFLLGTPRYHRQCIAESLGISQ